ncbi:MAG: hypothetical protein HY056_05775 [Proteobacteria bacterium]|nr:hypothetical protein [Pseudomonadota bacterium]
MLGVVIAAELAIGVADEIGDIRVAVAPQRVEPGEAEGKITLPVDRGVGRAVAGIGGGQGG